MSDVIFEFFTGEEPWGNVGKSLEQCRDAVYSNATQRSRAHRLHAEKKTKLWAYAFIRKVVGIVRYVHRYTDSSIYRYIFTSRIG